MTIPSPLERAARAAYTRPDSSIPWKRRKPHTRAYWRSIARRALTAALYDGTLTGPIHHALLRRLGYDNPTLTYTLAHDIADAIRAHLLAATPVVRIVPEDEPDRVYGEAYGGGWDDDGTAAEAARVARESKTRHRQHRIDAEGEDQS